MKLKNIFSTDRKMLYNVIFALLLGVMFGNFLGNKIIKEDTIGVVANTKSDEIYLIQTGIFYDETSATLALNEMKTNYNIESLVVKEHNKYYLYHGVATDPEEFNQLISLFDQHQIDYFIKSKSLYKLLEQVDANTEEYNFYRQSIQYYLFLLKGKNVTIEDDFINQIDDRNLNLFNHINALNNNIDTQLADKYELHIYKNLADILM